ncbi:hypothetical protein BJ138DRAFT_1154766 [Hygrophoropsis aurantiaca]|uniref:Uncharacterized protein n=1 Tax=Hygrophoropsis aurantiaca TaxID=72124 RepID=A0ACB8AAB1_9AGAM|nr:hypothetical protein BJ138DRAFT_1154766 [Hygrophoropsis aurantiaca]
MQEDRLHPCYTQRNLKKRSKRTPQSDNEYFCDAVVNVRQDSDGCLYVIDTTSPAYESTPSHSSSTHLQRAPAAFYVETKECSPSIHIHISKPLVADDSSSAFSQIIPDDNRKFRDNEIHLRSHHYYYPCGWYDGQKCNMWRPWSQMLEHLQTYHGLPDYHKQPVVCCWNRCQKSVKKESLARHIAHIHEGIKSQCETCKKGLSRTDSWQRHSQMNPGCYNAGFILVPGPNAILNVS